MLELTQDVVPQAIEAFKNGESYFNIIDGNVRVSAYPDGQNWCVEVYLFQTGNSPMILSATTSTKGSELKGGSLRVPSQCNQTHLDILNGCFAGKLSFVLVDKAIFVKKGNKRRQIPPHTHRSISTLADYFLD